MNLVDHNLEPRDEWRQGVMTRMRVSAKIGSTQICLFEQWCIRGSAHRRTTTPSRKC